MGSNRIAEGFTQDEKALFESLLRERRRTLLNDFQALEEAESRGASESSTMPSHLADLGSDRAESDVTLGRRESASTEIQEIDEALERIQDGSFGLCENCDRLINKGRLEAIPYARLCLPCKTEEER